MMQFIETLYADPLLKFLVDTTLKSFVIFAVAGLFVCCLRHKSAAVRGFVWGMAIIGCLVVPLFSLMLPKWEVKVLPEAPIRSQMHQLTNNVQSSATPVSIARSQSPSSSETVLPIPSQPNPMVARRGILSTMHWTNWMAVVWTGISVLFFARLIAGIGAVWHISAHSNDFSRAIERVHANWNRHVSVRLSDSVTVPMVWGFLRPVILLPTDADRWHTERLRAVLLHELAHIKRRDWAMQTIAQITCAIYWFNPCVWFAARWIRIEAEQACDDQVLSAGYQSTDYAQHLLDITRNVKIANATSRAAVAMARSSKIEGRLQTVLAENLNRHPITKVAIGIGLLLLICFAIPMGTMRLAQAINPEETLYQQILTASKAQPTPEELLPKPNVHGQASGLEKYRQNWERCLAFCEEFLNTYPNSNQSDAVWFEKLNYLFGLQRYTEFDAEAEAFLSEVSTSKYTDRLRRFRVYRFMDARKFDQALAELDKIVDPAMLPEVYQRKAVIYDEMDNWKKANEFDLLWAELILGKPAPKFSHTSVDGTPVSLQDLRGKVVLLYYWSAREDIADMTVWMVPTLKRLYNIHRDNPNFALINVCTRSSKAEMTQFIEKHAMPGIHLHLEPEAVPARFGVITLLNYLPRYVILDKTGIIRENGNTFRMGDFKIEHLVNAVLAEDTDADSERIIPEITLCLADAYLESNGEKSIAEREKLLAFMPNNLDLMMDIFNLEMFPNARIDLMNRAYKRMLELHQLDQTSPELGLYVGYHIHELTQLFAEQGAPEKTWQLFQIAVVHDRIEAINKAKENDKLFALLQDKPEFQKLLAEGPPQKPNEISSDDPAKTEQIDENVEICKQQLLEIGKAVQAYQKEHGDFPEWLSDLHPKYLPDANLLLCAADKLGGKPVFGSNADPKMPVSYGYQFHPGYRKSTAENRAIYGEVIPLARCRHHTNQPFDCLNLSFALKVYPSSHVWENTPEEMYGTPKKTIEALEAGLQQLADNEKSFYVYRSLVRLYIEIGREKDAENLINRFKSTLKTDNLEAHFLLGAMLEMANRDKEVLAVFEKLEQRYPDNYYVLDELAQIHEGLGNAKRAEEYRKKADPMAELVGKVVPDFSATALDGKPISLQDYRGKVVLLDFWAVWCGPCLGEMPNVKRVYNIYKDQGFDIIGVSLDTDETRLRNYLKENNIPWRQIFSGQKWKSPLAQKYHIRSIPAPWLISKDGTLISREARGGKLERLVLEALTHKIENE